ncbi:urea carboxylase [Cellvibrio japonicus]|uniref:Biotin carboxylase n=1 Tax=Cellvibrio japonicus (strain Ueda107) TaxID=498211 RepID=B3PCC7_CELJU|nr:urea carboxylase [Cellvibrio japonicus]ACE84148.1 urea amidolyase [Cellvibrio japonicus Ueda107]QEI11836.1 urea carboxylase [Cellvibrio japonicus]QEI15410.1 urea carboxylase [Cellvibrio japonicus]QEI18989.1 urea carboxylase [Cellvibrio japonicus]
MLKTVLIANRGEIAVRIAKTLKKMGIESVAVYSDADRNSAHVTACDKAICLGGNTAAESYLKVDLILAAAKETGAQAIIPGYGFLSENANFCEKCEAEGIAFCGPTPEQIRQFGLKHTSRELAEQAGVPLTPGTGLLGSVEEATHAAATLGYPVMLKSTAGGGGIGLTRCNSEAELVNAYESVKRLGQNFFSDSGVFLERFVDNARHVEVQIFGDGKGNVLALGERDCSLQRRNQKVVEETPAPNLPAATREQLLAASVSLGKMVNYRSAGTIEYIYDPARDEFYFLEVNTRLQVEHPITEACTGVDLVEWMILTAAGTPPNLNITINPQGAAIEVRLYAEDPVRDFQPSPGVLTDVVFPEFARIDTWVATGTEVSPYYDPMIAKIIVYGKDRADAIANMGAALNQTRAAGIATNLDYLRQIIGSDFFADGDVATNKLAGFNYLPPVVEVLQPGTYTSVQDYPGRVGLWSIGVPPSGPMDDYAFRLANRIVGNHDSAAALEYTIIGPKLKFHSDAIIALAGASSPAKLDGEFIPFWRPVAIKAGQILDIGKTENGCRGYLAVRQGFDVPVYLGSRSTFALGQFGGHAGRTLRATDMLPISNPAIAACTTPAPVYEPAAVPAALIPSCFSTAGGISEWEIGVLYGPHGAPDFFKPEAIDMFFSTAWEVHYNSNRLGIRLNGPKPTWTRSDGGEAGLHPSNIHDTEYAIGSINFTGDMPVILTKDGPSLGGFVCPVTIVKAELWKVGQVKPGDKIRFVRMSFDDALNLEKAQDEAIATLQPLANFAATPIAAPPHGLSECILASLAPAGSRPLVSYRQAGDKYILLEYGDNILELSLRLRVHALMETLKTSPIEGIIELSPGVRSLQINYDSRVIHQQDLIAKLLTIEETLGDARDIKVPSRIVHLPMAFEDSATLDAVARYRQSVRDTAPWLPSNTEFMRRINGLDSVDQVKQILFDTSYMVLGLGDVYLGAPCAVPVDPRHRLLTSKYNPARTYTAEGTVGIGGVYMCIYGMDSPGGYQLVGRTLPIWNKFLKNPVFTNGEPWLLKFFDRVRYYEVSEEELTAQREAFREGRLSLKIEEAYFSLAEHEQFLHDNAASIAEFKAKQQQAFTREVALWQADEAEQVDAALQIKINTGPIEVDGHPITADISGNIWKLLVEPGQLVEPDQPLLIVEAMKMEFSVYADRNAKVSAIHVEPGKQVNAGDLLLVLEID